AKQSPPSRVRPRSHGLWMTRADKAMRCGHCSNCDSICDRRRDATSASWRPQMIDTDRVKRAAWALCASLMVTAMGCGSDGGGGGGGTMPDAPPPPDTPPPPPTFSNRISRSSTIAITEDNSHVAMVNPDDGSLSVFATADNSRTAKIATGGNPSSVVVAADNKTAYVANRADSPVVRITGIDGGTPF